MSFFLVPLSLLSLLLSVVLGLSASSLLLFWLALELNMLSFSFYLWQGLSNKMNLSKYFIAQSGGSLLLLLAFVVGGATFEGLVVSALLVKVGFPPFHWWLVSLVMDLGYPEIWALSCVQKLLPLSLLMKGPNGALGGLIGLGLVVGVGGMLKQALVKKLLAYSSIILSCWLLASTPVFPVCLAYASIYGVALFLVLSGLSGGVALQQGVGRSQTILSGGFVLSGLLSMGGFPPFLGFFGKVLVLTGVGGVSGGLAGLLAASAPLVLYGYTRLGLRVAKFGAGHARFLSLSPAGQGAPGLLAWLFLGFAGVLLL